MRNLLFLASIATLAACSEPAPEPATEEATAEPATMAEAPAPGDYVAVYEDGTEQPFTMNADGTWTGTGLDGAPANGSYAQVDGKTCFTTDPPAEDDSCWTNSPAAADGSFETVNDQGVKATVKPAAVEAPAAE